MLEKKKITNQLLKNQVKSMTEKQFRKKYFIQMLLFKQLLQQSSGMHNT